MDCSQNTGSTNTTKTLKVKIPAFYNFALDEYCKENKMNIDELVTKIIKEWLWK